MLWDLFLFGAGLVVGWNFLPQPEFVKNAVTASVAWVKAKVNK